MNAAGSHGSKIIGCMITLLDELPSILQTELEISGNRQSIMGHSMGGHGAITIALKNQEKYRSVSAFAPIASPMNCPWGIKAFKLSWR